MALQSQRLSAADFPERDFWPAPSLGVPFGLPVIRPLFHQALESGSIAPFLVITGTSSVPAQCESWVDIGIKK